MKLSLGPWPEPVLRSRMRAVVGVASVVAFAACSEDKKAASDTSVPDTVSDTVTDTNVADSEPGGDTNVPDSTPETEVVVEHWTTEIAAIRTALENPTAYAAGLPNTATLGDDSLSALVALIPQKPVLTTTPNADGLVGDPAEDSQPFQDLQVAKPRRWHIRLSLAAGGDATGGGVSVQLDTTAGILTAHRVSGDATGSFDLPRTPPTPASLRTLSVQTTLAAGQTEGFDLTLFFRESETPVLKLTVAGHEIQVDPAVGTVFDTDNGISGSIGVVDEPPGTCRMRHAHLIGVGYSTSADVHFASFGGVFWEGFTQGGYLRGVVGADSAGAESFVFKLRSLDGSEVLTGHAGGSFNRKLAGELKKADGTVVGSFTARIGASATPGDNGPVAIDMTLASDCGHTEVP